MTLPVSGKLGLSLIGSEAKKTLLSPIEMNDPSLRKLVNKKEAGTSISVLDFYGKTWGIGPGFADTDFVSQINAAPSTLVVSNAVSAQADSYLAIFCDRPASYRINGGSWTDKAILGALVKDDIVEIQVTVSTLFDVSSPVTVKFGASLTKTFDVATGASTDYFIYAKLEMSGEMYVESDGIQVDYFSKHTSKFTASTSPTGGVTYTEYTLTDSLSFNYTGNAVVTPVSWPKYTVVYPPQYVKLKVTHLSSDTTLAGSNTASITATGTNMSSSQLRTSRSISMGTINGVTKYVTFEAAAGGFITSLMASVSASIE